MSEQDRVKRAILVADHGEPEAQKNGLVEKIIVVFTDPEKWPMTDSERIALLKELYRTAQMIRRIEDLAP